MSYREHASPAALAPWLACTWERTGDGGPPVRVVPDGCIDIVWTEDDATRLVGANSTAFLVALDAGTRVAGARFRPGAAPGLLGVGGEDVRDCRPPIGEVWGSDGDRLADELEGAADPRAALETVLLARLARAERPDPVVREVAARLTRNAVGVAALAEDIGVSQRQLNRRVSAAVGYGPKRLARVLRLERALAAARAGDELARVAFDAGYADQAHFTNDCSELAGVPPTVLLAA